MIEKIRIQRPVTVQLDTTSPGRTCALQECSIENGGVTLDAIGLHYRDLNNKLREFGKTGIHTIELHNIYGQRYIGTSLKGNFEINISGTPGNDLGAFMDGPRIHVYGNAQDGCGNTMNSGEIIVHGSAGDIAGYAMRGGRLFIQGNVGYRAGIHMKEYGGQRPSMMIGGTAGDFLAEYMAGGVIVLLGLDLKGSEVHRSLHVGTGMHGGRIYVHGKVSSVGREVVLGDLDDEDFSILNPLITDFCKYFAYDPKELFRLQFSKLSPSSERPYGRHYAY